MLRLLTRPTFLGCLLAALVLLVFWPGLTGPFLFDDYANIVSNPLIQIDRLDWPSIKQAAGGYVPGLIGRPLATIGFALDFYTWGKLPWGYKLHSLALHAFNALLVFALVQRLLAIASPKGTHQALISAAIALFWAVHPLQVSTVLYVVQRMEMLAHTFVFLALILYLHGRQSQISGKRGWPWLAGAVAMGILGLGGKESAVLLPAYTFALELTLFRFAAANPRHVRAWKLAYLVALLASLAIFFAILLPKYLEPASYAFRDFTLGERLLTQLRVLPMYLQFMVFPLPRYMVFYYDSYPISTGLFNPASTAIGAVILASLAAGAVWLRKRAPLVSLGILWFFAAHLITSNVISLEMAFEHRNYFALLGVCIAIAEMVRRFPVQDTQSAKVIVVAVLAAFILMMGAIRAATWGNELHLATDLVAHNPTSPRASNDLATLYMGLSDGSPNSPFFAWGIREFERASRLANASPLPEQGLILSAAATGTPVDPEWWKRMQSKLATRTTGPQEMLAVMGLVKERGAGLEIDDRKLAETYLIIADRPGLQPAVYAAFGDHAITRLGDEPLAAMLFLRAIDASTDDPAYARRVIEGLFSEGHDKLGQAAWNRAKELNIPLGDLE